MAYYNQKHSISPPKASLLLTTFELPHHLSLVLAGLKRQTARDFEIIICDDGSGLETRRLIENFISTSQIPAKHLWQEHRGFRKCKILNEAIRQARGEILVFLDGDCIPHKKFILDHIRSQETGRYLAGRRVDLSKTISGKLTPEQISAGYFDFPKHELILSGLRGETKNLQRSVRISWNWVRCLLKMDRVPDLLGSNFSISKEAMQEINGFDESYEGYGREDTDVELRLQNLGYRIKSMKGLALQFHVWHPRRIFTPANDEKLTILKQEKRVTCERGLIIL